MIEPSSEVFMLLQLLVLSELVSSPLRAELSFHEQSSPLFFWSWLLLLHSISEASFMKQYCLYVMVPQHPSADLQTLFYGCRTGSVRLIKVAFRQLSLHCQLNVVLNVF